MYADELELRARASAIRLALQDIADAEGDVDAYVAQYDAAVCQRPGIAAGLLCGWWRPVVPKRRWTSSRMPTMTKAAGPISSSRTRALRSSKPSASTKQRRPHAGRCSGDPSAEHLRAFIAKMPDFEDQDALERAFAHADAYPSTLQALAFFSGWPAFDRTAGLVLARAAALDGNHYEILSPAADKLAARHPLAATILLRAMIDFTLREARSSRYRHAARHLMDCAGLAGGIADFGGFETHEAYVGRTQREHGRKERLLGRGRGGVSEGPAVARRTQACLSIGEV